MRVPTYATDTNLLARTLDNKQTFEKYNFQSITGLKSPVYSGYGMRAYNIVSMEASLNLNNSFIDKNQTIDTETKLMNTSLNSIYKSANDFKSMLSRFGSGGMTTLTPDYTGGKIVFGNNTVPDYYGKTLTLNGVEYTFTNGSNVGNDIDISSATTGADIATLLDTKLGSPAGFTFTGDTVEFPLYTVNGTSSVLNVTGVTTGEPHTMTTDQYASVKQLQNLAFSTMKILADSLNIDMNGKFLFGGGAANSAPVVFPFNKIEDFQAYYDGNNVLYPTNAAADLTTRNVNYTETGNLTLELDAGAVNTGTIVAANSNAFLKEAIVANPATTGTLTFDQTTNSLNATQYGAFNTLKPGDTLVIGGAASGANNLMYVIKDISADGKTIHFDDSTPVVTNDVIVPSYDVTFSTSFPVGSVVNLNGFGTNIAGNVQVTGVSTDGKTLYITADPNHFPANGSPVTMNAATTVFSMQTESYYKGGDLSYDKRISEYQTIVFDVNANNPAFETLFRALGEIAQGGFVDQRNPKDNLTSLIDPTRTQQRVNEAMDLIANAFYNPSSSALNADLQTVLSKMTNNQLVLENTVSNQELVSANLENEIYNVKNVDQTDAAAKAILAKTNLEASYSVLNSAMSLSLLNYLK